MLVTIDHCGIYCRSGSEQFLAFSSV